MKAVILAAGLGTRLRPLTFFKAKAVIPLLNIPLLFYNISFLKKQGIKDIIINLHHLPYSIENALFEHKTPGMNIVLSHEPVILGTAGALNKAKSFLEKDAFLVINGDTLIDLDLEKVLKFHWEKRALATMVVLPYPSDKSYSPVIVDSQCRIIGIKEKGVQGKYEKWMFSGLHILQPALFNYVPADGFSNIIKDFYLPALTNNERIFGFKSSGFWQEIGTLRDYIEAHAKLFSMGSERIANVWGIECDISNYVITGAKSNYNQAKIVLDESVEIKEGITIEGWAIFSKNCKVEEACTIKNSILFENCIIGEKSSILNSILLQGVQLAPRSEIKNAIVIPETSAFIPSKSAQKVMDNYILPL